MKSINCPYCGLKIFGKDKNDLKNKLETHVLKHKSVKFEIDAKIDNVKTEQKKKSTKKKSSKKTKKK